MRRPRFRRMLTALIATLAATAVGVLLTMSASSAATTSTPVPPSHSSYIVKKTVAMQEVRVTKLISSTPDKAGQDKVQLANGATVPIPQATAKKVMSKAAQEAAHPDGIVYGNCGSSYITLTDKPNHYPVAMQTGFTVIAAAIGYSWSASVSGPDYAYEYESGGPLDFDSSWNGGYQSSENQAAGVYFAAVDPTVSIAVLWDGNVCFSGGPVQRGNPHRAEGRLPEQHADRGAQVRRRMDRQHRHSGQADQHNDDAERGRSPGGHGHGLPEETTRRRQCAGGNITGLADADQVPRHVRAQGGCRPGHLIANQLGGKGMPDDGGPANLVPCWQQGRNIGPLSMRESETEVFDTVTDAREVGPDDAVYFVVSPVYLNPASTIPYEFSMTARIERANGTSETIFTNDVVANVSSVSGYNLGN